VIIKDKALITLSLKWNIVCDLAIFTRAAALSQWVFKTANKGWKEDYLSSCPSLLLLL
jgi:hypothetical protein